MNTLLGNLKSSIEGSNHGFTFYKYAARYLAGVQYRFNRRIDLARKNPRLLRPCTLMTARPEKWLRLPHTITHISRSRRSRSLQALDPPLPASLEAVQDVGRNPLIGRTCRTYG